MALWGLAKELKTELARRWQVECVTVGPRDGDSQELLIPNRKARWTRDVTEYSDFPKHAKAHIEEWLDKGARPVKTPGGQRAGLQPPLSSAGSTGASAGRRMRQETSIGGELAAERRPHRGVRCEATEIGMVGRDVTKHRAAAAAARLNYLTADKSDIAYAVKKLARRSRSGRTSRTSSGWRSTYMLNPEFNQIVQWFQLIALPAEIMVHRDSNWAGCGETCQNTIGGVIRTSCGTVKRWSSTQNALALSSTEAGLYALFWSAGETLVVQNMAANSG